jgi:hypothetical protein
MNAPPSNFYGTTMLEVGCAYIRKEQGCLSRGASVLMAYPHAIVIVDSGMTKPIVLSPGAGDNTVVMETFPGTKISDVLTTLHLRGASRTTPAFIITNRGMSGGDEYVQGQRLFAANLVYDGYDTVQLSIDGPEKVHVNIIDGPEKIHRTIEVPKKVYRTIHLSHPHTFVGTIAGHQGVFVFYRGEDGRLCAYSFKLDLSDPLKNPVDAQDFVLDPAGCEKDDIVVGSANVSIPVDVGVFQRPITDLINICMKHNIQDVKQGSDRMNTMAQYRYMPITNGVFFEEVFRHLMSLPATQQSVLTNGLKWASPDTAYEADQHDLLMSGMTSHAAEARGFKRKAVRTERKAPAKVQLTEDGPAAADEGAAAADDAADAGDGAGPSNVHELREGEAVPGPGVVKTSLNQQLMDRLLGKGVYSGGPFGFDAVLAMQPHLRSFGLPVVSTWGFRVLGFRVS